MITARKSLVRTVRQPDPDFSIIDGLTVVPRAGFEINQHCPKEYKMIILECINNGWLKPVAHMRDYELMMDKLYE